MKILYVVSTLKKAGPTSQLYYILSNLPSEITPILITLSPESSQTRLNDFRALGIKHYQLNLSRLEGFLFAKKKVREIIEKESPDLIHTQGLRGDMIASEFASSIPVVCTVRNFPQLDFVMTYGKVLGGLMAYFHIKSLRNVHKVCGVSNAVRNNLVEHYKLDNVVTVRNGVDNRRFKSVSNEEKLALRQNLGLKKEAKVFISTGHLSTRKDPLTLIRAFKNAFNNDENVLLLFAGDGELLELCRAEAGNNVVFLGRIDAIEQYLQASDYYISASLAEGMPNAVLEALSCGIPCVLSDISPHKELLDLKYDIGYQFETSNIDSCSSRMASIAGLPNDFFKENIRRLVDVELTAESMAARYSEIYKGSINR